jgi:hypothetical protein
MACYDVPAEPHLPVGLGTKSCATRSALVTSGARASLRKRNGLHPARRRLEMRGTTSPKAS